MIAYNSANMKHVFLGCFFLVKILINQWMYKTMGPCQVYAIESLSSFHNHDCGGLCLFIIHMHADLPHSFLYSYVYICLHDASLNRMQKKKMKTLIRNKKKPVCSIGDV
ncbi:hypothetical protein K501DRAFT_269335 [Backusella circina FSU 941]|nr:hypothetical protein K501DRAFT_269335 [Backusella circina FSU 941]